MKKLRRSIVAVMVALSMLSATAVMAGSTSPIYVLERKCNQGQTVRYSFTVHSNSTAVTGFYVWMTGWVDGQGTASWNGAFKAVSVPKATTFSINTGLRQVYVATGTYNARYVFTSGSPAIPAPNVVYGGGWCG